MISGKKYLLFILFALCGIVWLACTQERQPCATPLVASLNMEMQHVLTDTSTIFVDTALPGAEFIPISNIPNKGPDTDIYPQSSSFTISLSTDHDTCRWAFTTDSSHYGFDTITFYYQKNLQFISNSCGYSYFYNLDTVFATHSNPIYPIIDSIHILNKSVTNNVNTTQLQICIHPDYR